MNLDNKKGVITVTTTVQKWGNSIGLRIPKRIADKIGVVNGSEVELQAIEGKIIVNPVAEEITLENLLAKCKPENRHNEIDFGKPEGNEIW